MNKYEIMFIVRPDMEEAEIKNTAEEAKKVLTEKNATVTMCDSKTTNLKNITKNSDIVISAVGKANFITEDMIKEDAIVLDVGICRVDGKVMDTPGFSSLDFSKISKEQIKDAFIEFSKINCPFRDCSHTKEAECLVRKEVMANNIIESRYSNYLKFIGEE